MQRRRLHEPTEAARAAVGLARRERGWWRDRYGGRGVLPAEQPRAHAAHVLDEPAENDLVNGAPGGALGVKDGALARAPHARRRAAVQVGERLGEAATVLHAAAQHDVRDGLAVVRRLVGDGLHDARDVVLSSLETAVIWSLVDSLFWHRETKLRAAFQLSSGCFPTLLSLAICREW